VQEPDSFPEGRLQAGLHKRSAEDKGGSCARQGRSPLGGLVSILRGNARDRFWGVAGFPRWDGEPPRQGRSLFAGPGWELGKGKDLPRNVRSEWLEH
jgi:hypothetical protein